GGGRRRGGGRGRRVDGELRDVGVQLRDDGRPDRLRLRACVAGAVEGAVPAGLGPGGGRARGGGRQQQSEAERPSGGPTDDGSSHQILRSSSWSCPRPAEATRSPR